MAAIANADPAELVPILLQVRFPVSSLGPRLTATQAQPNKVRLAKREDEEKFHEKLVAKAKVITDSANRLWRRCVPSRWAQSTNNRQRCKCARRWTRNELRCRYGLCLPDDVLSLLE